MCGLIPSVLIGHPGGGAEAAGGENDEKKKGKTKSVIGAGDAVPEEQEREILMQVMK